jgi:hypothetical protein
MEPLELTGATDRIPLEPMRELVYGRPRRRLPTRLIFVAVVLSMYGCAHFQPRTTPDAPETVGQLAPSYNSIAVAPLKHDAPPELGQVIDTSADDAPVIAKADGGGDAAELPEVAPKTDGVKTGEVR